ncbi:MAG: DUF1893 domain-containing protein [Dehalococcoidales bacterium]|nr:DUF1893 domain-containing protein [Dehalococcoidales bacterium]
MNRYTFNEFVTSRDTLRVYKENRLLFASSKKRLLPLLEYIDKLTPYEKEVIVFDRVVGNAAALLLKKILCREVYSPLGSQHAANTLDSSDISYHFTETVPYIQNQSQQDMCPMEKLSLNKSPEEFYRACLSSPAHSF